ncbi:MAG: hypothetical protein ACI4HJ_07695, partial [Ruminococcus sp.]
MNTYRAGIDIGSTTVKLAILDENNKIVFGAYIRHQADTQSALKTLLSQARDKFGEFSLQGAITGSGAINLGKA